jgi:hypothetical protein
MIHSFSKELLFRQAYCSQKRKCKSAIVVDLKEFKTHSAEEDTDTKKRQRKLKSFPFFKKEMRNYRNSTFLSICFKESRTTGNDEDDDQKVLG